MSANMQIDQVGLPAGTVGRARTDGLATGALVTLTNVSGGTTHRFQLLWVPPGDTTAVSSLVQTGPNTWTFSPTPAMYGSYRIELIVDEGLPTEERQVRIFGVRTPAGLLIPAANESADSAASLVQNTAAEIARSENNEAFGPFVTGSAWGWWRALAEAITAAGGKRFATYVVGNAPAGDTAANCDFLDPGDGSGIVAACAAAYSVTGRVIVRRGIYTRPVNATPISVPAGCILEGEGAQATVIVAPFGDVATLPWQTFVLAGPGAEVTDLLVSIPDRDPASLVPTSVISVFAVAAINTAIRRVLVQAASNFLVAAQPLSAIHFVSPDFNMGGQVFEDVTFDLTYAAVTGHATNQVAACLCSSGDFATPYALPALSAGRFEPLFVRCKLTGGKTNEAAVPPYYTVGAFHALASEMTFTDCDLEGVLLGYGFFLSNTAGTIAARGPRIVRGLVRPAPGVTGLFVQGALMYATDAGGTLTVRRFHVEGVEVDGPATGVVNPGIYVTGNSAQRDIVIDRCTITANTTTAPTDASIVVTGTVGALTDVRITNNAVRGTAGAVGRIDVDLTAGAIVLANTTDQVNVLAGATDTNVAIDRVRQVAGITDAGVGTSQTGNIVG